MNEILKQVEEATGLPRSSLASYGLIGGVVLVMLGVGNVYITTLLGVVYPVFQSFLALETKDRNDDKQWLTYWVCYGVFSIIDQFAGIILQLIPFYFFLKLGFLVYLFHPSSKGAITVYDGYLSQYVKQYRSQIEGVEKSLKDGASKVAARAEDAVKGAAGESQ